MPDFCVWNRCNNKCTMCSNPADFQRKDVSEKYSFENIVERTQRNADSWRKSRENINLTGGEPTIHPRFLELCYWFRKNFPYNRLVLATNGRMFSYSWFAKNFLQINNIVIETAILGPTSKLHDAITRVNGSFEQTLKGISNILKYRGRAQETELRVILIKQNYKLLGKILSLIFNKFSSVDRVTIIFPEPEGECGQNYEKVGITYAQVKEKTTSTIKKWSGKFKDLRLYHFPLCTINPKLWKYAWITQRRDEVDYLPICNNCSYKRYCCGIHKDYLKIIGGGEFKPPKTNLKFQIKKNPYHPIIGII